VKRQKNYPESPIVTVDIPVWLPDAAEQFVAERVDLHSGDTVPECTDQERWARKNGQYIRCENYCAVADFCPQFNLDT